VRPQALHLQLDDAQLERKVGASQSYPELHTEVERALQEHGRDAVRNEWLSPVEPLSTLARARGRVLAYERYGEERVRRGYYASVVRHDEHFAPLADRLVAAFAGVRTPR
jgi:IS5 family transposase